MSILPFHVPVLAGIVTNRRQDHRQADHDQAEQRENVQQVHYDTTVERGETGENKESQCLSWVNQVPLGVRLLVGFGLGSGVLGTAVVGDRVSMHGRSTIVALSASIRLRVSRIIPRTISINSFLLLERISGITDLARSSSYHALS